VNALPQLQEEVRVRPEPGAIVLRPESDADLDFLCALYGSTREEELAQTDWSREQKDAFIRMQFDAQRAHYRTHYDGATFDIVEIDGEPVGRLYVYRGAKDVRIVDIALQPSVRGRGVGGTLLRQLIAEALPSGKTLSIHVERFNPAMRLYQRLGFRKVNEHGVYDLMELAPW
jgi:GNAT superfamily N-acetyltransferase